jgi:hypothetical protein
MQRAFCGSHDLRVRFEVVLLSFVPVSDVHTLKRVSVLVQFSVQKCIHGGDADWNGIDYDSVLQAEAAAPYMSDMCMCDGPEEQGVVDKVMDKMFTKAGRDIASAVVGTVVRDLMTAYLESGKGTKAGEDSGPAQQTFTETVFDMACTEKGRALVTDCVTTLVVNAVTVFLDKTADVNVYDEMLASMSKPGNREQVHDLIGTVANSAIDTLVRTSHDVLTGERPSRPPASALRERTASLPTPMLEPRALWPEEKAGEGKDAEASPSVFDFPVVAGREKGMESRAEPAAAGDGEGLQIAEGERLRSSTVVGASRRGAPGGDDGYSWLHQLFQTMIDPRNRRLLMDVTGVAAYEAIRALIAGLHDVLWRSAGSGRRQGEGAPGWGAAVVSASRMVDDYFRAIAAKALVCVTICLALCLNMVSGVAYP